MIYNPLTPLGVATPTTPVTIPADFCGMHWFQWPAGTLSNPALGHKNSYQHDYLAWGCGPTDWARVETSQGVYDWSATDAWIEAQYANGISPVVSHLYMPSFYSTNPSTLSVASGGYYGCGGPLTAQGRTGWSNFVTASINRYKNRGTPIKYWQSWEEPWWPVVLGSGYWWGTQGDLVDLSYISYTAAKAVDSSIIVLSPSASPPTNATPTDWTTYTGTVNTTVHGYDTYDWYGVDLFGYTPTAFNWGLDVGTSPLYKANLSMSGGTQVKISDIIKSMKNSMGANLKPIACNSFGFSYVGDGINASSFRALSATKRKQWVARSLLEFAANGVPLVTIYGGDAYVSVGGGGAQMWAGDFVADTSGVIAGFKEAQTAIAGKTMTSCGYLLDGTMKATFTDGSSYTI